MSFVKSKPHNSTKNHNNWLRALRALADCLLVNVVLRFGTSMLFRSGSKLCVQQVFVGANVP